MQRRSIEPSWYFLTYNVSEYRKVLQAKESEAEKIAAERNAALRAFFERKMLDDMSLAAEIKKTSEITAKITESFAKLRATLSGLHEQDVVSVYPLPKQEYKFTSPRLDPKQSAEFLEDINRNLLKSNERIIEQYKPAPVTAPPVATTPNRVLAAIKSFFTSPKWAAIGNFFKQKWNSFTALLSKCRAACKRHRPLDDDVSGDYMPLASGPTTSSHASSLKAVGGTATHSSEVKVQQSSQITVAFAEPTVEVTPMQQPAYSLTGRKL